MKLVAAAGDIDIVALTDNVNLSAKLDINLNAKRITLNAEQEVIINGGGSYVKFSANGIEHGTNGNWTAHATKHSLVGPNALATPQIKLPPVLEGAFDEAFVLQHEITGEIMKHVHYRIKREDGSVEEGVSDENGLTHIVNAHVEEQLDIEISE